MSDTPLQKLKDAVRTALLDFILRGYLNEKDVKQVLKLHKTTTEVIGVLSDSVIDLSRSDKLTNENILLLSKSVKELTDSVTRIMKTQDKIMDNMERIVHLNNPNK